MEAKVFINYMKNIVDVRNMVAHNNCLLKYRCKMEIMYSRIIHGPLHISSHETKNTIYHLIVILRLMLSRDEYEYFCFEIRQLANMLHDNLGEYNTNIVLSLLGILSIDSLDDLSIM